MALTNTLLTQERDNIKTDLQGYFTHGAIGTDGTVPISADIQLGTEVLRKAIDLWDGSAVSSVTASLFILTTEANGNNIQEAGWFNAPAAGTMWTRNTLTAITKTNDIQLYLDTTITITVEEI